MRVLRASRHIRSTFDAGDSHCVQMQFRDLAMEVEYHRLKHEHLRQWAIPMALERLSLRKDAPRDIEGLGWLNGQKLACCQGIGSIWNMSVRRLNSVSNTSSRSHSDPDAPHQM
jgi:hypothetical protein